MLLAEFSFLGVNWTTIAMHFVVFAVLVVGLTFLLYKPVIKFVRKRQEDIQKGIDEGKARQEEGEAVKREYLAKIADSQTEADRIVKEAKARADQILAEANQEAKVEGKAIREKAMAEADEQKKLAMASMKQDAGQIAIALTKEILQREVSKEDNDKLIDECLKAWGENE